MKIHFEKYQASGNDFILINNFEKRVHLNKKIISFLCDRNFGIGADGIIIIQKCATADFEMIFFNPDGTESMCGNGSKCAVNFAIKNGLSNATPKYLTYDGYHKAYIKHNKIYIQMNNIIEIKKIKNDYFINSGAPHHIKFVKKLKDLDILEEVNIIRSDNKYKSKDCNINFIQIDDKHKIQLRTFEKGVEKETQSCGTGAVASSIASTFKNVISPVTSSFKGGNLTIHFEKCNSIFKNIFLVGKANFIYSGDIII